MTFKLVEPFNVRDQVFWLFIFSLAVLTISIYCTNRYSKQWDNLTIEPKKKRLVLSLVILLVSAFITIICGIALTFKYISIKNGVETMDTWSYFASDISAALSSVGSVGIVTLVFSQTFGKRYKKREELNKTTLKKIPIIEEELEKTDISKALLNYDEIYFSLLFNKETDFVCTTDTDHSKEVIELYNNLKKTYIKTKSSLTSLARIKRNYEYLFDLQDNTRIPNIIKTLQTNLGLSLGLINACLITCSSNYDVLADQKFVKIVFSNKDEFAKMADYEKYGNLIHELRTFERSYTT